MIDAHSKKLETMLENYRKASLSLGEAFNPETDKLSGKRRQLFGILWAIMDATDSMIGLNMKPEEIMQDDLDNYDSIISDLQDSLLQFQKRD